MESVLNNKLGDSLDDYFMRLTTQRWKKKEDEHRLNTKGERMGLKTGKHFSKPNPIFFHDAFMSKYEKKLEEKKKDWGFRSIPEQPVCINIHEPVSTSLTDK